MRRIIQTNDISFIKRILSIEQTYDSLVYDGSPTLEQYIPSGIWFILVDGSDVAGIINLQPVNNVLYIAHIFIFELYRGKGTEVWGEQVANFMQKHCNASKILAITPYIAAKRYAEKVGFKDICVLKHSIKKNGTLMDQYMLELSLGEEK